jgi:hypothetical protein
MRNAFVDTILLQLVEDQKFVVIYISSGFWFILLPSLHPSLLPSEEIESTNHHSVSTQHPHPMSHGGLQSLSISYDEFAQTNPIKSTILIC